jgi:hypothetical protein
MTSRNHFEEEEAKRKQDLALEAEEQEAKQRRSVVPPNAGLDASFQCDSPEEQKAIVSAYNKMFGGKPGYVEPVVNTDGSISLSFPEKGDAEGFCVDQAKKGRRFIVIDAETKTVMAYSNGDGTLYHANGDVFKKGDSLKPSSIPRNGFELPEPRSRLGM